MNTSHLNDYETTPRKGLTYYWDTDEACYIVCDIKRRLEIFKSECAKDCSEFIDNYEEC